MDSGGRVGDCKDTLANTSGSELLDFVMLVPGSGGAVPEPIRIEPEPV